MLLEFFLLLVLRTCKNIIKNAFFKLLSIQNQCWDDKKNVPIFKLIYRLSFIILFEKNINWKKYQEFRSPESEGLVTKIANITIFLIDAQMTLHVTLQIARIAKILAALFAQIGLPSMGHNVRQQMLLLRESLLTITAPKQPGIVCLF